MKSIGSNETESVALEYRYARYLAKIYTWEKASFYTVTGGSMQVPICPQDGGARREWRD
jgi:hypothetical protein